MKMLLTSTGLSNKALQKEFLSLLPTVPEKAKVLFIPTAAIDADALAMVPACRADLTDAGVFEQNIVNYDCDRVLTPTQAAAYNAVYVCGGDTAHLVRRLKAVDFKTALDALMANGGVYIGASAGAIAAAAQPHDGMDYLHCDLHVHCESGSPDGPLDTARQPVVYLTNLQGVLLTDTQCRIIE